ncbi:hypothetical protein HO817_09020 [Streptococcus suis]|nr:hypothetical protein [Streptococcus suis]HEM5665962.1 hypothetical protein [Streptococcus suis]
MYEFVLEYGSFPVKLIDGFVNNRSEIPDFLKEDEEMIARLNEINELFYQLFLTIECKFDYIGKQFPDKIEQLRTLYHPLADDLLAKYGNQIELKIEPFIL